MNDKIIHQQITTITETYYGCNVTPDIQEVRRISRKVYVSGDLVYQDNLTREEEKNDNSIIKSFLKFILFEKINMKKRTNS